MRAVREILEDLKRGRRDAIEEFMRHPIGRYKNPNIFGISSAETLHRDILEAMGEGNAEVGKRVLQELNNRRTAVLSVQILRIKNSEDLEERLAKDISRNPVMTVGRIVHLLLPEHRVEDHASKAFNAVNATVRALSNEFTRGMAESKYRQAKRLMAGLKRRISAMKRDPYAPKTNYDALLNRIEELEVELSAAARSRRITSRDQEKIAQKVQELREELQRLREIAVESRRREWENLLEQLKAEEG